MDAVLTGTGGADGWPQPGCRCASCLRARAAGMQRWPGGVTVDGRLEFRPGQRAMTGTGSPAAAAHRIDAVPGGWDVTGPDGARLLLAAGPGQVPEPPPAAGAYDIALLDLLTSPAQLGLLRSAGLVTAQTAVVALYTDHRVSSAAELARRCALWRVRQGEDGQLVTGPVRQPAGEPRASASQPRRTLIIGGARSGKSTEAELRLSGEPQVTYLAAGPWRSPTSPDGLADAEWAARVARHRVRRPPWWQTVESLDVAGCLRQTPGGLLIDGVGTWLAGVMDEAGLWADSVTAPAAAEPAAVVQARIDDLVEAWQQTAAAAVAVTDDVGSGLVPPYPAGRVFRDELGWLNQRLAAESELVLHLVAGRVTTLPG
ncbi:MAG: bifunctional adenosylcobinamide kinase/adenosylcobinamide-phosphate guanylyltransferase [Streptosporangiaceae bacterium]